MIKGSATNERGFTLLEIIVAVTVLAVAFTGLFRLFGGTLYAISVSERYARAAILSEQKMNEILFTEEFPPENSEGVFEKNADFTWKAEIGKYKAPIGRTEPEDTAEDTKDLLATYQINLAVLWKEGGRVKSLELATLKTIVEKRPPDA